VEGQGLGVEHEAPVGDLLGLVAVEGVACDGVAEVVEVDADLVSPARAGTDLKQCGGFETVLHAKFGDAGLAAFGIDGNPAGTELPQGRIDGSFVVGDDPVSQDQILLANRATLELPQDQILLANRATLELPVKPAMGFGVPGENDHTAGFFVQPVHDVESFAPFGREDLEERSVAPEPFRNRRQPLRLVDREQVIIFEQNGNHRQKPTSNCPREPNRGLIIVLGLKL